MAKQLVYTSAPRGLFPGSSGYCTVALTEGFPRAQAEYVEKLSAYRINDRDGGKKLAMNSENYDRLLRLNPPNIAHIRYQFRGNATSVLLKTSLAGFDYSNRLRKLTHYLLIDEEDKTSCDLGGLMSNGGVFLKSWDREPETLPPMPLDCAPIQPQECRAWQRLAGDAGWAGELVRAVSSAEKHPVHIVYDPRVSAIPLLIEVIAILPPERRWETTFSTNYVGLQSNVQCQLRFIPAGSPEAQKAVGNTDGLLIDLTTELGIPPSSPEVESSRSGRIVGARSIDLPDELPSMPGDEFAAAELSTRTAIPLPEPERERGGHWAALKRFLRHKTGFQIGIAIALVATLIALFVALRNGGISDTAPSRGSNIAASQPEAPQPKPSTAAPASRSAGETAESRPIAREQVVFKVASDTLRMDAVDGWFELPYDKIKITDLPRRGRVIELLDAEDNAVERVEVEGGTFINNAEQKRIEFHPHDRTASRVGSEFGFRVGQDKTRHSQKIEVVRDTESTQPLDAQNSDG